MEGWDAGDNAEAIANTPAMQIFQKKGIEVLSSDLVSLRAVFRYRHQIVPFLATCSRGDLENSNRKNFPSKETQTRDILWSFDELRRGDFGKRNYIRKSVGI